MKILQKGKRRLFGIANQTDKLREVVLKDGDIIIGRFFLPPDYIMNLDIYFLKDLRIAGKGSRGAYFDGYTVRWPI